MKMMCKKVLAFLLVFSLSIGSLASVSAMEKDSVNIGIVEDGEYKVISMYDESRNEIELTTYKNGELVESLLIDIDKELVNYQEKQEESEMFLLDESSGRVLERKVTTVLDYEFERWYYPNFLNGEGKFWNLRTFSNDYRMMYEERYSPYSQSLSEFVSGVETIKEKELVVGVVAMVSIGAAIATGGVTLALQTKIQAILVSLGIVGAASQATQIYTAISKCQSAWNFIYN